MQTPEALPPDAGLDLPAARAAASAYREAEARGLEEGAAWQEAAEVFALHHPSWPRPLAEWEAARAVAPILGRNLADPARPSRPVAPPSALLAALANPVHPREALPDAAPWHPGARPPEGILQCPGGDGYGTMAGARSVTQTNRGSLIGS